MPKSFFVEQLLPEEIKPYQKNDISVFLWRDEKEICIINTMSNNAETTKINRDKELIMKPFMHY